MADPGIPVASNGTHIICKRCNVETATQLIRSEKVCSKCFCQYVTTKAIKRMETYRMRGSHKVVARKLLLPLSFGPCSTSLLHILDGHLQGQFDRMNRAAYELFVVHVDQYVDEKDRKSSETLLEKYKTRFPRHTYISIGLEEALNLESIDWKSLNLPNLSEEDAVKPATERLQKMIGSMPSPTSRTDILTTLLNRLLVDVGKKNECEGMLFGESTTRLAEKTLTETAKGRGFSLPWQVSDGNSPYGIAFNYPLRDLLKKELVTFSSLATPSLEDLIILQESSANISTSSKDTTIDDLMAQYFESVEKDYPSIVANVMKQRIAVYVVSRLKREQMASTDGEETKTRYHGWQEQSTKIVFYVMDAPDLSTAEG
ncbi:uncharacterized protein LY89DRAFT_576519 [Mollisia scopiformis]|uniref:Cytoplasmic tRNA 2-thiolation protein 2 n=1 Tax=Mollisia scopiformis TaxID=149040 RepID=A0A194XQ01_MOLSC|nr:uncharacterized protein LY89DRAFT_576519 [Mollisia scopiformis]KUJ22134.1 hypothetical protein LY89DRAFT_576519 [Mollisia scopiformis]